MTTQFIVINIFLFLSLIFWPPYSNVVVFITLECFFICINYFTKIIFSEYIKHVTTVDYSGLFLCRSVSWAAAEFPRHFSWILRNAVRYGTFSSAAARVANENGLFCKYSTIAMFWLSFVILGLHGLKLRWTFPSCSNFTIHFQQYSPNNISHWLTCRKCIENAKHDTNWSLCQPSNSLEIMTTLTSQRNYSTLLNVCEFFRFINSWKTIHDKVQMRSKFRTNDMLEECNETKF